MEKIEIAKILEWHNSGTLKTDEAVERIFSLFNVVKQSELLKCCNYSCNEPVHKEGSVYCEFHKDM